MEIIEFYKQNLCDYAIIKKYYKSPIAIMLILYAYILPAYFTIIRLMKMKFNNSNSNGHDLVFIVIVAVLFLVVIPIFFRIKEFFLKAKEKAIKEMCQTYSLPSYHIQTSKYNTIRKLILEKHLKESNLYSEEKLNVILNKIRFELVDKKITKSNRNYIITIFAVTLITTTITKFVENFLRLLGEAKFLYSNDFQIFVFNSFVIIIFCIVILSTNIAFNMAFEGLEDIVKLRKHSYLLELEEIIYDIIIKLTK